MSDSKKDLLEGSATVGAAVALTAAGAAGAIAAAIPTLVNVGFNAVKSADQRRAQKLFERMLLADEEPTEFADSLNSRLATDPDVVAAFRALMVAAIEAVALAALEPIALVGRQYLRGRCPTWIARSWLRVLTELSEPEIGTLRRLVHEASRRKAILVAENDQTARESHRPITPTHLQLRLHNDRRSNTSLTLSFNFVPTGLFKDPSPTYTADFAERLWQLLTQNHLGTVIPDEQQLQREWAAEESRANRRAEAERKRDRHSLLGGVQYSVFDQPREYSELLQLDDVAFDVIAEAFPVPTA